MRFRISSHSTENAPHIKGIHECYLSYLWNFFVLLVSSAVITVLSLLLAIGMYDIEIFYDYFRKPLLFLLNYIPVLFLQTFLYFILNRQWAAFSLTALFVLGCSAGDFYKMKFRSEPFSFADISMIQAGLRIAGEFDLTPNGRVLASIVCLIIGTGFTAFFARARMGIKLRISGIIVLLLSVFPLWKFVYSSGELYYGSKTSSEHVVSGWAQQEYASKGFVYPFLYSIADSGDTDTGLSTLNPFLNTVIEEENKVDIVVFQMESFNDLRLIGIEGISDDAYSVYDSIKSESFWGKMLVNVFAGGTIDTEHRVLTGEDTFRSIKKPTESFVRWLADQGYYTTGNHPNTGAFYNRRNVNSYLGFDEYFYSEELYEELIENLYPSPWFSDSVLFSQVLIQLQQLQKETEHVFSFNVSMQGHSPYETEEYLYEERYWNGADYTEETNCLINNYLGSVVDTQKYLSAFLASVNNIDKPVIVLIYGDHKPWLGDGDSTVNELGINLNPGTDEGYLNRYSTEYLLWANDMTKNIICDFPSGEGDTIMASELIPMLLSVLKCEPQ